MQPSLVAERCNLLRTFSTDELLELEDVRGMLECIVSTELCPTDGDVYWRRGGEAWNKKFYDPAGGRRAPNVAAIQNLFYDVRHDQVTHMPANQLREQQMDGWGDDINQYHAVNDLLKLNPAQVMQLYEHAVTRHDVEHFVDEKMGSPWFWNNGETMLHTWLVVLHGRGVVMQEAKEKIDRGLAGVAVDGEVVMAVD